MNKYNEEYDMYVDEAAEEELLRQTYYAMNEAEVERELDDMDRVNDMREELK